MGDHREAIIDGARSVLRTGTVFDLTPEAVAFAGSVDLDAIHEEFPASEKTCHLGEIVLDIAESTLNELMVEIASLEADDDWVTNLADTTVVLLTSDANVTRQVLPAAASLGRGQVRNSPTVAVDAVSTLLDERAQAGEDVADDRNAELRLILTLFRGVVFAWATDRFDHAELHQRMREVGQIVISQRAVTP
ncbi:MAG: hypothetical protein CL466_08960 [Acidimicrobiaceae bacterium]|nr:hypothetical protein [Acidimicrobiaceae bacterium]|tara:strand:+ start:95 stop:670 length:576 start_codon:yes stop_codon:yes gene_type:complete